MDPVQTATVEVNPRLESAGSTSANSADGYDAKNSKCSRHGLSICLS